MQVFYPSRDGTRVPMFLVHKRGLPLDGNNPTLLYAYGGFNVTVAPEFNPLRLALLEQGFVYASANIRGGGEYGETWHQAGMKLQKQNVFDDFIAAAEWLIGNRYTSPARLAISGGSNGGLLVGTVINQRPDLFAAAVPQVGVMDMLRFQKFTIGWNWVADYGSSDNPQEFEALYRYSPLHNIREGGQYRQRSSPPRTMTIAWCQPILLNMPPPCRRKRVQIGRSWSASIPSQGTAPAAPAKHSKQQPISIPFLWIAWE